MGCVLMHKRVHTKLLLLLSLRASLVPILQKDTCLYSKLSIGCFTISSPLHCGAYIDGTFSHIPPIWVMSPKERSQFPVKHCASLIFLETFALWSSRNSHLSTLSNTVCMFKTLVAWPTTVKATSSPNLDIHKEPWLSPCLCLEKAVPTEYKQFCGDLRDGD